jgi:hypothetical protein
MGQDEDFKEFLQSMLKGKDPEVTESRTLLKWFLFNVFNLDDMQADEAIVDKKYDKGIDGVWPDDDTNEVYLFSSVFTDRIQKDLGDKDLREFVGSVEWFSSGKSLKELLGSNAHPGLKASVTRNSLVEKLEEGWEVRLVFVTTKVIDHNSSEYQAAIAANKRELEIWDRTRLVSHFKNLNRKTRIVGKATFTLVAKGIEQKGQKDVRVFVAPIQAKEIATLNGIDDRSLFLLNVRSGLGKTRVNKDLAIAVKEKPRHPNFLLFHNGVTIICGKLEPTDKSVTIENFSVVNGCQSAIAFRENEKYLTPELLVLARFIEVGGDDQLADEITYRSNNQNGISMRDLRANDRIQLSLKNSFEKEFGGAFSYLIKAGENAKSDRFISNDKAAQLLIALYLNEPYFAHQKDRIFATEYTRVFNRNISAKKIYLAWLLLTAIESVMPKVEDPLIRSYQLTKFIILGLVGEVLRQDVLGKVLYNSPEVFLPKHSEAVSGAGQTIVSHMMADFNFFIKEQSGKAEYYDYKSEFKNADKYSELAKEMIRLYQHTLVRNAADSFEQILKAEFDKRKEKLPL